MFPANNWFRIPGARKKTLLIFYCIFILLLLECSLRLFLVLFQHASFFRPSKLILQKYPELHYVYGSLAEPPKEFRILLLGGSTLNEKFGRVPQLLEEKLRLKGVKNWRIYNMSKPAHTTRDSYFKYRALGNRAVNVVVIYHGINEVRANNCPPELFRPDYSHYAWYELLNLADRCFDTMNYTVIPYSFGYLYYRLKQILMRPRYVPLHAPEPDWIKYGGDIKTAGPFRTNIENIIRMSAGKHETVILMTFAYYIPADYSPEAFKSHSLDYRYAEYSSPIEIWGNVRNVTKGLRAHNAAIREVVRSNPSVEYIDMEKMIPRKGIYFRDVCHLSERGSGLFADILASKIAEIYKKREK